MLFFIRILYNYFHEFTIKMTALTADVGGQRCPDSVRIYCVVPVSQKLKFSVGRVFECPDFEFELDFDRQTPHSKSGQRCPPTSDKRNKIITLITQILSTPSAPSSHQEFNIYEYKLNMNRAPERCH